jgi:hypothetical protein
VATLENNLYHYYVAKALGEEGVVHPPRHQYKVRYLHSSEFKEAVLHIPAVAKFIGMGITTLKVGSCRPGGRED